MCVAVPDRYAVEGASALKSGPMGHDRTHKKGLTMFARQCTCRLELKTSTAYIPQQLIQATL